MADRFEQVVNLCKRRGFVFPSAEIYGGFRSTYDYGPLGSLMLRNVKNAWWQTPESRTPPRNSIPVASSAVRAASMRRRFVSTPALEGRQPPC